MNMEKIPEQIPMDFGDTSSNQQASATALSWKNNPNIKPDASQFPDSENIINIEFRNGEWMVIYRPDDAGEMYKR